MYAFKTTLKQPFEQAVQTVTDALAAEKFGVVSDINVQGIFKAKLDVDYRGYRILGACKPGLAKAMVDADPDIGALLPCNVVVYENGPEESTVAFLDPVAVFGLSVSADVKTVAQQAKDEMMLVKIALDAL